MKIRTNKTNTTVATINELLVKSIMDNTTDYDGIRLGRVDIELMRTDDRYQRPVNGTHVNNIISNFNNRYLNCIIVSLRDGYFYILDGQHRFEAAKAKGVEKLLCLILTGLTSQEEAKMFKDLNVNHKALDPYKIFKANIWNGNTSDKEVAIDMEIKRICDKHNIEVKKFSRGTKGKTLRCLSRARWIVGSDNYDGTACFEWIIDLLNITNWAEIHNTYIREVILMLKSFWLDNKDEVNFAELEKKLVNILNATSPNEMLNKAKHDYPKYGIEPAMGLLLKAMMEK